MRGIEFRGRGVLLFVLLACSGLSQQSQWSVSRLGFAFDAEQRSVRPILGHPGAALLGSAWKSGLDDASISPDGRWILCRTGDEAQLYTAANANDPLLSVASFQQVVWAKDARRFASLSAAGNRIEFFELSADGQWRLSRQWAVLGRTLRLLGIEAQAGGLWFSASGEGAGLFFLSPSANESDLVASGEDFSALAIGTGVNWAVDSASGRLLRLMLVENAWKATDAESFEAKKGRVSALAVLPDGGLLSAWLPLSEQESPRLMRHDAEGKKREETDLDARADSLDVIDGQSILRLQRRLQREDPLLLYDGILQKVFFVPVPPRAAQSVTAGGEI